MSYGTIILELLGIDSVWHLPRPCAHDSSHPFKPKLHKQLGLKLVVPWKEIMWGSKIGPMIYRKSSIEQFANASHMLAICSGTCLDPNVHLTVLEFQFSTIKTRGVIN